MKKFLIGIIFFCSLILFIQNSNDQKKLAKIDFILVEKAKRTMSVFHKQKLLEKYKIALGFSPIGHKKQEGDGKTPEGIYSISCKIPNSAFNLALQVSYPSPKDLKNARKRQVSPGGNIMIHGLKKGFGWLGIIHHCTDWTLGCIAVTDEEIQKIYNATSVGTTVEIRP